MQDTFRAPTTGIGPNRYLDSNKLFVMIGIAFFLHLTFLIVADLLPEQEIKQVPVRALNLKLGDSKSGIGMRMVQSFTPPAPKVEKVAPKPAPTPAPAPKVEAPAPAKKQYTPPKLKKIAVSEPEPVRKKPMEQPTKQVVQDETGMVKEVPLTPSKVIPREPVEQSIPTPVPVVESVSLPAPTPAPAAISATPQEYVRELAVAAAAPEQGVGNDMTGVADATSKAEILKRYEQLLSSWIQRHKIYPDEAKALKLEGEPIIRIRIDRQGNVRYSSLEKLADHRLLNIAAMEMIKRANPVPAVPANYPGGNVLEFLIPVSYKLR